MKSESSNTFANGLVMDLNPLTTPNNLLTDCINGTFLTFNGDELVLQSDMGNGVLKDGSGNDITLTDGFKPLGVKEYGGVLYIVSGKDKAFDLTVNYESIKNLHSLPRLKHWVAFVNAVVNGGTPNEYTYPVVECYLVKNDHTWSGTISYADLVNKSTLLGKELNATPLLFANLPTTIPAGQIWYDQSATLNTFYKNKTEISKTDAATLIANSNLIYSKNVSETFGINSINKFAKDLIEFGSYPSPYNTGGASVTKDSSPLLDQKVSLSSETIQSGSTVTFNSNIASNDLSNFSYYDSNKVLQRKLFAMKLYHKLENGLYDLTEWIGTRPNNLNKRWFNSGEEIKYNGKYKGEFVSYPIIEPIDKFLIKSVEQTFNSAYEVTYTIDYATTCSVSVSQLKISYSLDNVFQPDVTLSFTGANPYKLTIPTYINGVATKGKRLDYTIIPIFNITDPSGKIYVKEYTKQFILSGSIILNATGDDFKLVLDETTSFCRLENKQREYGLLYLKNLEDNFITNEFLETTDYKYAFKSNNYTSSDLNLKILGTFDINLTNSVYTPTNINYTNLTVSDAVKAEFVKTKFIKTGDNTCDNSLIDFVIFPTIPLEFLKDVNGNIVNPFNVTKAGQEVAYTTRQYFYQIVNSGDTTNLNYNYESGESTQIKKVYNVSDISQSIPYYESCAFAYKTNEDDNLIIEGEIKGFIRTYDTHVVLKHVSEITSLPIPNNYTIQPIVDINMLSGRYTWTTDVKYSKIFPTTGISQLSFNWKKNVTDPSIKQLDDYYRSLDFQLVGNIENLTNGTSKFTIGGIASDGNPRYIWKRVKPNKLSNWKIYVEWSGGSAYVQPLSISESMDTETTYKWEVTFTGSVVNTQFVAFEFFYLENRLQWNPFNYGYISGIDEKYVSGYITDIQTDISESSLWVMKSPNSYYFSSLSKSTVEYGLNHLYVEGVKFKEKY